jgi:hypothetical protein
MQISYGPVKLYTDSTNRAAIGKRALTRRLEKEKLLAHELQ